jgi:hypothetical protein
LTLLCSVICPSACFAIFSTKRSVWITHSRETLTEGVVVRDAIEATAMGILWVTSIRLDPLSAGIRLFSSVRAEAYPD